MSENRSDFLKRFGLVSAKIFLGLYIFGSGIMILLMLLMYFFDESVQLNGEFGIFLRGRLFYILIGCALTGVAAYFIYSRIPDFVDLISPEDDD
jgi:hypothetical protein